MKLSTNDLYILKMGDEQQVSKFVNPSHCGAKSGSWMFGQRKAVVLTRDTEMAPLSPVGQKAIEGF